MKRVDSDRQSDAWVVFKAPRFPESGEATAPLMICRRYRLNGARPEQRMEDGALSAFAQNLRNFTPTRIDHRDDGVRIVGVVTAKSRRDLLEIRVCNIASCFESYFGIDAVPHEVLDCGRFNELARITWPE